jgi:hypothetical protein
MSIGRAVLEKVLLLHKSTEDRLGQSAWYYSPGLRLRCGQPASETGNMPQSVLSLPRNSKVGRSFRTAGFNVLHEENDRQTA